MTYKAQAQYNYFPFGSVMDGRSYNNDKYRFGFNGKEKEDGIGDGYDFGARIFESRLGRWLAVDPLQAKYPGWSPYNFVNNNPLVYIDPDGKDAEIVIDDKTKTIKISTKVILWGKDATKEAVGLIQAEINSTWNQSSLTYKDKESGITYNVEFDIQVELADGKEKVASEPWGALNPLNTNNFVEVDNKKIADANATDNTAAYTIGGDEGVFSTDPKFIKGVPHEIGHMLSLDHHYTFLGEDEAGWENNIMGALDGQEGASGAGDVEQKNIDPMVKPFVDKLNSLKITAEQHNDKVDKMKEMGELWVPAKKVVPTKLDDKIDDDNMDK